MFIAALDTVTIITWWDKHDIDKWSVFGKNKLWHFNNDFFSKDQTKGGA